MDIFVWIKQRMCKHKYKKRWSKTEGKYIRQCVKCMKIAPAQKALPTVFDEAE